MGATLEDIRSVPGLDDYLDALEERLARSVATHPGLVAAVGLYFGPAIWHGVTNALSNIF